MSGGIWRPKMVNFRGPHGICLFKCCMFADSPGLSSGHHVWPFQLFESVNAAVCFSHCFSSLLSVSSQGCYSQPSLSPPFLCRGSDVMQSQQPLWLCFGTALPALCFGWQMLIRSPARQLGMVSCAAALYIVPGCG